MKNLEFAISCFAFFAKYEISFSYLFAMGSLYIVLDMPTSSLKLNSSQQLTKNSLAT